ncbi:unnamed protein product [Acanthoscelides obtectus]|uniref:Double jelly roll-like domain-containing protein n=1 Tax=Acanthoscelides obtectus TaxID=200917 RepID=A0A9P0PZU3_ACAOB|nr:unnamed protein product [Acanthoscelides obtectus]CAK1650695.1 hypothetical protein AOBTE_LOCUS16869 [Acanthoscelides obtectus]
MVLHVSNEKLDVFEEPIIDHSLASLQEYTYKSYGSPYFKNSDIVHIPMNFQDHILNIADSYTYVEGTFTPSDATTPCYLSNNALAFLFQEISLQMGGEKVYGVRNPGITSTIKTMVSHGKSAMHTLLCSGWTLSAENSAIWDVKSKVFSGRIPLKHIMGFAEDYKKRVLNIKHELLLVIARSFKNCYVGECDAELTISKIEWKVQHTVPDDRYKVKLLQRLNKHVSSRIKVAFRSWDLYELPSLRSTSSDAWAIRTTSKLERPLFVIIGFQDSTVEENHSMDITKFINANFNSIRLKLNNQVFPYERWNLNFEKSSTPQLIMHLRAFKKHTTTGTFLNL